MLVPMNRRCGAANGTCPTYFPLISLAGRREVSFMRDVTRLFLALTILLLIVPSARAAAPIVAHGPTTQGGGHCPLHTVCDTALGIALTPPSSWRLLPAGKLPPHTLGLYEPPARIWRYALRLTIASGGVTHEQNDVVAANRAARVLTHGYTHMRLPLVRIPVRYGGAAGVMILNLPGQPLAFVQIILAHAGALYQISASGTSTLTLDQRRALASLRFIPRVGRFPPVAPFGAKTHQLGAE